MPHLSSHDAKPWPHPREDFPLYWTARCIWYDTPQPTGTNAVEKSYGALKQEILWFSSPSYCEPDAPVRIDLRTPQGKVYMFQGRARPHVTDWLNSLPL